jgi:hypothetical protein
MVKQVETRDRYRIHGETTLEQFGHVLAQLTKLGLENVGYELITDVAKFKERKERRVHDVPGHEYAKEFIKDNPTFQVNSLVKFFEANGRSPGAAYTGVRDLLGLKFLRKLGPGSYQLYNMKALPAPKKAAKPSAKVNVAPKSTKVKLASPKFKRTRMKVPHRFYAVSNKDFLLGLLKGKTDLNISVVNDYFVKDGRPIKSAGSLMTQLAQLGYCKSLGGGHWKVLAKAQNVKGSITVKRENRQQVNGVDVSPAPTAVEEIANG